MFIKFICFFLSFFFYIIDPSNTLLSFVFYFVLCFVHQIATPLIWSFIGDVDDYGEWKFKKRLSGICASGNLFSLKLSLAIGGAFVAMVLSVTGYVPEQTVQSTSAIDGLYFLIAIAPAIGYLASIILFKYFYKLNREKMHSINLSLFK